MKKLTLVVVLLLAIGIRLDAQTTEIDLNFAFTQMKSNGIMPFAKLLYAGDQRSAQHLADQLAPLVQGAGDFNNFELLNRRFLTKRVERVILVMYFENFPVYLRIDYYENTKGKICLPAKCSKEAAEILPFDLISAAGK